MEKSLYVTAETVVILPTPTLTRIFTKKEVGYSEKRRKSPIHTKYLFMANTVWKNRSSRSFPKFTGLRSREFHNGNGKPEGNHKCKHNYIISLRLLSPGQNDRTRLEKMKNEGEELCGLQEFSLTLLTIISPAKQGLESTNLRVQIKGTFSIVF